MSTRNRIRAAASTTYIVALIVGIFTGNFVWIAIGGAILLALVYNSLRSGGVGALGGRMHNRNRTRHRL